MYISSRIKNHMKLYMKTCVYADADALVPAPLYLVTPLTHYSAFSNNVEYLVLY